MKFEITLEQLEEMVLCIVHNELNEDESLKYAKDVLMDFNGVGNE